MLNTGFISITTGNDGA